MTTPEVTFRQVLNSSKPRSQTRPLNTAGDEKQLVAKLCSGALAAQSKRLQKKIAGVNENAVMSPAPFRHPEQSEGSEPNSKRNSDSSPTAQNDEAEG